MKGIKLLMMSVGIILAALGCSQEPVQIHYGSDECAHCRMMILEEEFAAQIVSRYGKAYKFDSIECMAAFYNTKATDLEGAIAWVADFENRNWLKVQNALFVQSEIVNSPMGASLLAFSDNGQVQRHLAAYPGRQISWPQVLEITRSY